MSKAPRLPAPHKGGDARAHAAITVAGALVDAFVPVVGSLLAQACGQLMRKRMEVSSEILITHIKQGNIELLDDDQFEAFIPHAYRFFEAARQGASNKKLNILAAFIAKNINESVFDDNVASRIMKKIDYLSDNDLLIMSKIYRLYLSGQFFSDPMRENLNFFSAKLVAEKYGVSWLSASEHIVTLMAAGFLIPDGAARFDKDEEYYYINSDFVAVCEIAIALNN